MPIDGHTQWHTDWLTDWQTQTDFIICPMLYAIAMRQIIKWLIDWLHDKPLSHCCPLQLLLRSVQSMLSSCWTTLVASEARISILRSRFYHNLLDIWTSTAATHAWVLSPIRRELQPVLVRMPTPRWPQSNQPFRHSLTPEAVTPTRILHLPTFVRQCWLQRQVTASTYQMLLSFWLMDSRVTRHLLGLVTNIHVVSHHTS